MGVCGEQGVSVKASVNIGDRVGSRALGLLIMAGFRSFLKFSALGHCLL